MKLLIVEDEPALAQSIAAYLSDENYLCEVAETYDAAYEKLGIYQYNCVLLDLMLPGGNGMDLLQHIRQENKETGVIIISAKNSLEDKITGLNLGADDYLAKPFHLPELKARIHSIIRRKQYENNDQLIINELQIDLLSKTVKVDDTEVPLTKKEYNLLLYFIANKNRVISKSALAEHLSGDFADLLDNHDFVYAHVKNLKKKLKAAGCENYLHTVYGSGYKWNV
ncbi:response regulator [bacterium]|nr:response regulator [bacterium]